MRRLALTLVACVAGVASAAGQTTWYVSVTGSDSGSGTLADPFRTIQFSIARAGTLDGDTVAVLPGTYAESFDFLGKAVRVLGAGVGATTVDATGSGVSAVVVRGGEGPGTELTGMTITGGAGGGHGAPLGGGLFVLDASPTITACAFDCNTAERGGGVYLEGARATFVDCAWQDNVATVGSSEGRGAGMYVGSRSSAAVVGGSFLRNESESIGSGGGVYVDGSSTLVVSDALFEGNEAGEFSLDLPGNGGAIRGAPGARLFVEDCTFRDNGALIHGGAIDGPGLVLRSSFFGNRAQFGGAAFGLGLELRECLFEGNRAHSPSGTTDDGGAVDGCTLFDCVLRGNVALGSGGAAYNATLVDCLVENNRGSSYPGAATSGGGVFQCDALRCVLRGNRMDGFGSGSASGGGAGRSTLVECVVFGNTAEVGGGAVDSDLTNCTVVANVATILGGGVLGGSVVTHSILWDNAPDQILTGSSATWSDVQGGFPGVGNFDADPRLWNPVSGDLHLMAGSPCIDAGDPGGPSDPDGSVRDVGAYVFDPDYCGEPGAYCTAKVTSEGCTPRIGFEGSPTLSGPDDLHVTASAVVPLENGLLFWGFAAASAPFYGGTRCVAAPLARTTVQGSKGLPGDACSGTFDFHFSQEYADAQGLMPGTRVYAQYWFRDPSQPDGTGIGVSDALEFTLCP